MTPTPPTDPSQPSGEAASTRNQPQPPIILNVTRASGPIDEDDKNNKGRAGGGSGTVTVVYPGDPINLPEWTHRLEVMSPCQDDSDPKHKWMALGLIDKLPTWTCDHCHRYWQPSPEDIAQIERLATEGAVITGTDKRL